MKLSRVVAGVVVVLVCAWWYVNVGLANKADNQSRDALREIVSEAQEQIPAEVESSGIRSVFADVAITSDGPRTVVYTYTYRLAFDADSIPDAEHAEICADESAAAHASTILSSMEGAGITDPSVRVEYRDVGGTLDFSCRYP
jgi:hypothetical protein